MPISGSDKALMFAQSGVGRAGATRSNHHSAYVFVSVGGTQRRDKTLYDSLSIVDSLDQIPNTCRFTVSDFTPAKGQEVIITLGSINNRDRIFAGNVLTIEQQQASSAATVYHLITATDYGWQLDRQLVSKRYTSQSATAIAKDLISSFATGFTSVNVVGGLATITEISFTQVPVSEALTRLAKRIGGYWYVDYRKDVHFFLTETAYTAPVDLTTSHISLRYFRHVDDLSQVITRVFVEGRGSTAEQAAAVGATTISITDKTPFSASGGTVVSGPQKITYTGLGYGYTLSEQWDAQVATAQRWRHVTWAPEKLLFVAVSLDGTNQVMTSPDGVTWTGRTAAEGNQWYGVAWAPALSLFVAVAATGTNRVMTSPDGITWTARSAAAASTWAAIAWSPALSLFAAVSETGATQVMTSPDGITWTTRTAASARPWVAIAWSPELALFVAVSRDNTSTSTVMTSPDGITWTTRTAASAANWEGVAWSSTLSLFTAVGISALMTSPDGITWTTRTQPETNQWTEVVWASGLGRFVAVANTGTNRIMVSSDGITWTKRAAPSTGEWMGVAWAPELGIVAAIGDNVSSPTVFVMTNTSALMNQLTGIPASGAGSIQFAINLGDDVNILEQLDDASAQSALATLVGGDETGIREEYLQDRRLSKTEAQARGSAILTLKSTAERKISYESRDKRTRAGLTVAISFPSPTSLSGNFKIQQVGIDRFRPSASFFPIYRVEASTTRFSLEDLLRMIRGGRADTGELEGI